MKKIYVMSPAATWDTDRYEQILYLLFHEFNEYTIIEQRDTQECPKGVSLLIFIRDTNKCITLEMWNHLVESYACKHTIKLARMDRASLLVLEPWKRLVFTVQEDGVLVGYGKPAKKQEKVEQSA